MPKLIVNPGSPDAWEIQLKEGTTSLGRNAANDVQLNDPSVSGSHCQIVVSGHSVVIKDLGSTNGTYVNQTQIQEAELEAGQSVHLGGVETAFYSELPQPAAAPPPPPPMRVTFQRPPGLSTPPPLPPMLQAVASSETEPAIPAFQHGPRFCKFHSKSPARYLCNKCNRTFCELCITARSVGGVTKKTCRSCGVECVPLQVTITRSKQRGFFASLPGSFVYPFKGMGVLILIFATVPFTAVDFISGGILLFFVKIAIYGLIFLFMQNIIHTTTADENETLGFPSAGDLFGAAFQLAATILSAFGLPIGLLVAKFFDVDIPVSAIIASMILGCIYFPMAFLAVAMKDSVFAANPLVVIPAIIKIPFQYLVACLLLMAVFGVRQLGGMVSSIAGGVTFETRDMSVLLIALGVQAIWGLISVYLLTVSMRILGLFYNANKEKLGWF